MKTVNMLDYSDKAVMSLDQGIVFLSMTPVKIYMTCCLLRTQRPRQLRNPTFLIPTRSEPRGLMELAKLGISAGLIKYLYKICIVRNGIKLHH